MATIRLPEASATHPALTAGHATVQSFEIVSLGTFPGGMRVVVAGHLPDGCTVINQISHPWTVWGRSRSRWTKPTARTCSVCPCDGLKVSLLLVYQSDLHRSARRLLNESDSA